MNDINCIAQHVKRASIALLAFLAALSCKDNEPGPGNPSMNPKTEFASAHFGDSLSFTVAAADPDAPLSTLKARLFFGEEQVSETVIRTKTNADYSGKIFVPYLAGVPDATATLKLTLQNIRFTIVEKEYALPLTRPDFPYLTLVADDGTEYRMEKISTHNYSVTNYFPAKLKARVKAPKTGEQGNELVFGWENGTVTRDGSGSIPFSNPQTGLYAVAFNTYSYAASPFVNIMLNGEEMTMIDDNSYRIDKTLAKNQSLKFEGIADAEDWWIDPDFFAQSDDGSLAFTAEGGDYRIIADFRLKYFRVEAMSGESPAVLQADGSGAVWIIGTNAGKPSLAANETGWNPDNALCMACVAPKKYQITLVGGKSISTDAINFKFFHQKGWGGEFTHEQLSTSSSLIFVGSGGESGRDPGNLGIVEGKSLDAQGIYVFTVDLSAGIDKAVLTISG
ncbi:MAG: DUF5125 domain-containing protein [Prevotellaceae bacterium]|jgi:hypothetical protein|nr:DUF5125 domain-containing protein [Prevotellaceae bacterium]